MAHLCQAVQLQVHPSSVAAVHHLCSRLSLLSLADICLILQLRPLPCAAICSLTRNVIAQFYNYRQQILVFEGSAVTCRAARSSPLCPSWLSLERPEQPATIKCSLDMSSANPLLWCLARQQGTLSS